MTSADRIAQLEAELDKAPFHRLQRTAIATAALVGIVLLPGGVLVAIAYWKWRREHRR